MLRKLSKFIFLSIMMIATPVAIAMLSANAKSIIINDRDAVSTSTLMAEKKKVRDSYPEVVTVVAKEVWFAAQSGTVDLSIDYYNKTCTIVSCEDLSFYSSWTFTNELVIEQETYIATKIENYCFLGMSFVDPDTDKYSLNFSAKETYPLSIGNYAFYGIGVQSITFNTFKTIAYIGDESFGNNNLKSIIDHTSTSSYENKKYRISRWNNDPYRCFVSEKIDPGNEFIWTNNTKIVGGLLAITNLEITDDPAVSMLSDEFCASCLSIEKITFKGDNIKKIGRGAFRHCSNIKEVVLPEGNDTNYVIKTFATTDDWIVVQRSDYDLNIFNPVGNLAHGAVELSPEMTVIDDYAFEDTTITSIAIPNTITKIGVKAFYGCSKLKEISVGCDKLSSLGEFAFANCHNIETVVLPETTEIIPEGCFYGDRLLKNFHIPKMCKKIEYQSFYFCVEFESVVLPQNLIHILPGAFAYCYKLREVIIENKSSLVKIFSLDVFLMDQYLDSISIPRGVFKQYTNDDRWNTMEVFFNVYGFSISPPATALLVITILLNVALGSGVITLRFWKSKQTKKVAAWIKKNKILAYVTIGIVDGVMILSTILVWALV